LRDFGEIMSLQGVSYIQIKTIEFNLCAFQ
jgi:hypothetical protein